MEYEQRELNSHNYQNKKEKAPKHGWERWIPGASAGDHAKITDWIKQRFYNGGPSGHGKGCGRHATNRINGNTQIAPHSVTDMLIKQYDTDMRIF